MTVYFGNILKHCTSLACTELEESFLASALHDETLSNHAEFKNGKAKITAEWGLNRFADTVALLGSNWATGRLRVESGGAAVYDSPVASGGRNSIIRLPGLFMVSEMELELESVGKLEIGILYAGRGLRLPLFCEGFKYGLNANGKAERTAYGAVYGRKLPPLRTFEMAFSGIDNAQKAAMEEYIDAVQYVVPHLVEPYGSGIFPPLYATLTAAGSFEKQSGGFLWNTSLQYMEAR